MKKSKIFSVVLAMFLILTLNVGSCEGMQIPPEFIWMPFRQRVVS